MLQTARTTVVRCGFVTLLVTATSLTLNAQSGRIAGVVRDDTGQPLKGAIVTAENAEASPPKFTSATDDKGVFEMSGLRSGSWRFSAQAIGFNTQSAAIDVPQAPASTPPLTITLRKVGLTPAAASAVAAKDLQAQLTLADQFFVAKQWDEAIVVYRAVLANVPLSAVYLKIGAAYLNKGENDLAIGAYKELLKRDPLSEKATIGVALATQAKGDVDTAEKMLEGASKATGSTAEAFYNLGEVKRARMKRDEALAAFRRAAMLDPSWSRPVLAIGQLFLDQGEADTAAEYFRKAIAIEPVSAEAAEAAAILERLKK